MFGAKPFAIALLCLCEIAALVLWFSATAVVPSIAAEYPLSPAQVSLFTSTVQAGFVAGRCMAGIYPLGMKMAAGWAKADLGLLVAILVGSLSLGWRFAFAPLALVPMPCGSPAADAERNASGTAPRSGPQWPEPDDCRRRCGATWRTR